MNADEPVIVVCSHPATHEAWWAHVQAGFADPQQRATRHLIFDMKTGVFDGSAADKLLDLANAARSGYVATAAQRSERLESNLLLVTSIPAYIYVAPCTVNTADDVVAAYRKHGLPEHFGWILRGDRLYSFANLSMAAPKEILAGEVTTIETSSWEGSTDPDTSRNFVALLNRTLYQDHATAVTWDERRKYLYFKSNSTRSQIKIPSGSGRSRTVVMPKPGKLPGAGYFWHAALKYRFLNIDGSWYVALIPTYHFTRDGVNESSGRADLLHGIKMDEKNKAVLAFTQTWARYLRGDDRPADALLPDVARSLTFGPLATFDVDRGIDDKAWAGGGLPRAAKDGQLELFDDYQFEGYEDL